MSIKKNVVIMVCGCEMWIEGLCHLYKPCSLDCSNYQFVHNLSEKNENNVLFLKVEACP